jgi:hypothetical protein
MWTDREVIRTFDLSHIAPEKREEAQERLRNLARALVKIMKRLARDEAREARDF